MSPRFIVTASAACPNREEIVSAATAYLTEAGSGLEAIPSDLLTMVRSVLPMGFEDAFELRLTFHVASKGNANVFPVLLVSTFSLPLGTVARPHIQNSEYYDPSTAVFSLHVSLVPAHFRKGGEGTKAMAIVATKEAKPKLDSSSDDEIYVDRGRGRGYGYRRGMSENRGGSAPSGWRGGRGGGGGYIDSDDNDGDPRRGMGRGRYINGSDSEDERQFRGGRGRVMKRPATREYRPRGRGGSYV